MHSQDVGFYPKGTKGTIKKTNFHYCFTLVFHKHHLRSKSVTQLTQASKTEVGCLFWAATLSYITTELRCFTNHRSKWGNWRGGSKSAQRGVNQVSPLHWQCEEVVSHTAFSYGLFCLGFFLQYYQILHFSESSRNGWPILTGQTLGISAGIARRLELPRRKTSNF